MKKILLYSLAFLTVGCSSTSPENISNSSGISTINYTKQLIKKTSAPIINAARAAAGGANILNKIITLGDDGGKDVDGRILRYKEYNKALLEWQINPFSKDVFSLKSLYANFCGSKGGQYINYACVSQTNEKVFFYAKPSQDKVTGSDKPKVYIVEPKSNLYTSSKAYKNALFTAGYRSSVDKRDEKRQAILAFENAKRELAQNLIRQNQERPMIRTIGSKVCRVKGRLKSIGYVERVANPNVQIRVSYVHFVGDPASSPGGFREHIIWDAPDNWHLCK